MSYLPIIIANGQLRQLPSGDPLDVGGWTLPTAGGSENFVLVADGSGNAVWSQSLVGLVSLNVDNITIDGAAITSDTGAINFNDENLSTTGNVASHDVTASGAFIGTQSDGSDNRVFHDVLSAKSPSGTTTGTMKITLPVGWVGSSVTVRIQGYSYAGQVGPWEVTVGGTLDSTYDDWRAYSAILHGMNSPFTTIRVAEDGTNPCILLGDLTTAWIDTQVHIVEVTVGGTAQTSAFEGGWTVAYITSESGLTDIKPCEIDRSPRQVKIDDTIFVKTTGSDTAGTGQSTSPFLTLGRVITELETMYLGEKKISVDIGPGVFNHTSPIEFKHPFGASVSWEGEGEFLSSQTTTSIDATNYDLPTYSGDLDYYEVTITLTGKTLTAGDYILIRNTSGGTNPQALVGCHKVESFISDVATIRIVHKAGTPHASGTITFDCYLVRTVLHFTACNGLLASASFHAGIWRLMVIEGDETSSYVDPCCWSGCLGTCWQGR